MIANFMDDGPASWNGAIQMAHNNRANVTYYDGHAESQTATQLRYDKALKIKYFFDRDGVSFNLP